MAYRFLFKIYSWKKGLDSLKTVLVSVVIFFLTKTLAKLMELKLHQSPQSPQISEN